MEFFTRKKVSKPKLRERESVPASPAPPSGVRNGRQVLNRPISPPTLVVPQPYLTPVISTKKDDKQTSVSSQIPVRSIPPPKLLSQRNAPEGGKVRKLTRSHSERSPIVDRTRRRKDLAYLVVDLKTGTPTYSSNLHQATNQQRPVLGKRSGLPARSKTMSSPGLTRPVPVPRHKTDSLIRERPLQTQDDTRSPVPRPHTSTPSPISRPVPAPRRTASKVMSLPPSSSEHGEIMDDQPSTASDAPLIRGTSVPEVRVAASSPDTMLDPRERRTSLDSKADAVAASNKHSPSKQTPSKPKPSRPPPPSSVALQRVKERKARSLSQGSCLPRSEQQHDYEFDTIEGEDMHETQLQSHPQPRRLVLNRTSTLSLTSQTSLNSRSSSSSVFSATPPNRTSTLSLTSQSSLHSRSSSSSVFSATPPNRTSTASSLDSIVASDSCPQSDGNVYEPMDLSTPVPPPRRKRSIKKGHHSPKLTGSKDVPPELPQRGYKSDPLIRRKITPPTVPQKSQLARTIGLKASAAREAKLQPFVGTYSLTKSPDAVDAPEDVCILPGEPEPDIGGVDEYVDMQPVSAWQLERASTGVPHATAEELVQDQPEDSYVQMHPAGSLPLTKEEKEEEEEEDQPEPLYIQMNADEYIPPPSLYYASKDLLNKRPDLQSEKKRNTKTKT